MATAMIRLLSDAEERERLAAAFRERFDACYETEHVVDATVGMHRSSLGVQWGSDA